jgi:hypothetical protein
MEDLNETDALRIDKDDPEVRHVRVALAFFLSLRINLSQMGTLLRLFTNPKFALQERLMLSWSIANESR